MQLLQRQPDGQPLRAHLLAAAGAGAPADPRLAAQPPAGGLFLWQAFAELCAARPAGLGPAGVPPSEVLAWQALRGLRLTPWEVDTLAAMDAAALVALQPKAGGVQ